MSGIIRWEDPAALRPDGPQAWDSEAIAADLRDRPGVWALVRTDANGVYVTLVKKGRVAAFQPSGSFEACSRKVGTKLQLYARYVGEAGEYR